MTISRLAYAAIVLLVASACISIRTNVGPPSPTAVGPVVSSLGIFTAPPPTLALPSATIAPVVTPTPTLAIPTIQVTATPAPTAGVSVTSEEALLASMLEPADVDATAETSGVTVGDEATDLPAFADQGGLRRAAQTFDAEDGMTVYDFRYQFPTATAAGAFLDAEETGLGEVDFGAIPLDPPVQLGDDTRYYRGHTEIFVIQDSYNFLIRVGNVVAKIWVGGDPEVVTEERAANIAQAAAERMEAAFGEAAP